MLSLMSPAVCVRLCVSESASRNCMSSNERSMLFFSPLIMAFVVLSPDGRHGVPEPLRSAHKYRIFADKDAAVPCIYAKTLRTRRHSES